MVGSGRKSTLTGLGTLTIVEAASRPSGNAAVRLRVAHTADLDAATTRQRIRALLDDVFDGRFTDDDWEHALGGMHAVLEDETGLVGHASVVQRRLWQAGHAWRTGYVEAVGVRAGRRGIGYGARLMDALERVIRSAYDFGALSASDDAVGFYAACGWLRWRGPSAVLTPRGIAYTPEEDGSIFILPVDVVPLDVTGEIACDPRPGDVW